MPPCAMAARAMPLEAAPGFMRVRRHTAADTLRFSLRCFTLYDAAA